MSIYSIGGTVVSLFHVLHDWKLRHKEVRRLSQSTQPVKGELRFKHTPHV